MKIIYAVNGQEILVDDSDYEELAKHSWYVNAGYAARRKKHPNGIPGKTFHLYMHRYLLGLGFGERFSVDHKNRNTLDNQRTNIRKCTHAENQRNKVARPNNKSGLKGVSWDSGRTKWHASIRLNGRSKSLGRFECPKEAYEVYCLAADMLHGEFANHG